MICPPGVHICIYFFFFLFMTENVKILSHNIQKKVVLLDTYLSEAKVGSNHIYLLQDIGSKGVNILTNNCPSGIHAFANLSNQNTSRSVGIIVGANWDVIE